MPLESSSEHEVEDSDAEFVEVDPSGRYGRYKEVLGKGACKKVYRAFDELEGIEVAWNQIKVSDFLRNPEELERLYSEVHLLKTLKHKNIIKFYNSWVDAKNEHINFITEIFTSGTLRQYRKKHKHVDVRALKNWSKQILEGLLYLHSHDPPIIHRDLKCDNIFVNGNQGEVKIGDLGLAAILCQARSAHSVIGTPEFMAPELYEEEYNELVDIYAFGMCLLELVTFEYPYIECANAAQIYKKVTSGVKPGSLTKVKDPEVRSFIEKCIGKVSERLSAKELLMDHFLHKDEDHENIKKQSKARPHPGGDTEKLDNVETTNDTMPDTARDFTLKGQMRDPNTVFLKLRIEDTTGHVRNIHFPFDIKFDTQTAVAREMVEELDLTDQDVSTVAEMIEAEIQSCFSNWTLNENSNEVPDSTFHSTFDPRYESQSPSTNRSTNASPGFLSLERLPSGRLYCSDEPKNSCSPLQPINVSEDQNADSGALSSDDWGSSNDAPTENMEEISNRDDDDDTRSKETLDQSCSMEDKNDNVSMIVEKLEHIMVEQQKELDELKKQHGLILSDILMKLPPETRQEVVSTCKVEILKAFVSKASDHPFRSKAEVVRFAAKDGEQEPMAAENHKRGHSFKHKFKSRIEYSTSSMGIAVILRNDSVSS